MRAAARIIRISDMRDRIEKLREQGVPFRGADIQFRLNDMDKFLSGINPSSDEYYFTDRMLARYEDRLASFEWVYAQ